MKPMYIHKKHVSKDKIFHEINSPGFTKNTVSIQYNVGSIHDPKGKEGLTHLIEHLLFKNKNQNEKNIDREKKGLSVYAYTYKEKTIFTASSYLLKQEDILKELFNTLNFNFSEKDFKNELEVIKSEISEKKSDNSDEVYDKFLIEYIKYNKDLKKYKHPVIGVEKNIKNISFNDIKEHIKKYYGSPVVTLTSSDKLGSPVVEKIFEIIPSNIMLSSVNNKNQVLQYMIFDFNIKNTQVFAIGIKGGELIKRSLFLSLLRDYLGNNWSSVCNQEFRVKNQLAYYVNSTLQSLENFSILYTYCNVSKKNIKKVKQIYNKIIKNILTEDIEEDTFIATKNMLLTYLYDLAKGEDDVLEDFLWFNKTNVEDEVYTLNEYIESLNDFTLRDFKKSIKDMEAVLR